MNIVTISYFPANPPANGGQLRVSNFNSALSLKKDTRVTQFSYNPHYFTKKNTHVLNNGRYIEYILSSLLYCSAIFFVWIICRVRTWWFMTGYLFKALIRPKKKMLQHLKEADIVQLELPYLYRWIKKYTSKPVVIIAHNVEYLLAKAILESDRKKVTFLQKKALTLFFEMEKEALTGADTVLAVSDGDKKKIIELYGVPENKIHVVPNGINVDDFTRITPEIQAEARRKLGLLDYSTIILFTGSGHPPNAAAASFIENELAPRFDSSTLFLIAGSVGKKAHKARNVRYTGRIDADMISDCFKCADIAINPMPYGSGSNIKMFEYFASGLPTITTENGVEGVNQEIMKELIITNFEKFPDEVAALIKNKEKQKALSVSLREKARYHDYAYMTNQVMIYYEELRDKDT